MRISDQFFSGDFDNSYKSDYHTFTQTGQMTYFLERVFLLQLGKEHSYIRSRHKIKMKSVPIVLFDSDTRWGQFDASTNTISISRKLIKDHSWQNVVGVLHHEMAHQLVSESYLSGYGFSGQDMPHGEKFKRACRRLGVPEQYCRAGLDLQSHNLDWKNSNLDEGTSKVLERAKKLLALAESSNEHEAQLAMAKARELYARFNLDYQASHSKENGGQGFYHLTISNNKKKWLSWEQRVISLVQSHFFVQTITSRLFDQSVGEELRNLELIGTRENVLMAEYVYHFLLQHLEFLVREAAKTNKILKGSAKASFRLGVIDGFEKKLEQSELRVKVQPESQFDSGNRAQGHSQSPKFEKTEIGKALDIFRNDSQLTDYIEHIYPDLVTRRGSSIGIYRDAFAAGHAVGSKINLHKPVTESSGNRGYFIGQ